MSLEYAEHAKWVDRKRQPMAQYNLRVDELLSDSAARGFQQPPLNAVERIVDTGQLTKLELTGLNAQLYEEQEDIQFQIVEFALKLEVEYARLELAIYKQEILDALALEHAQMEYEFAIKKADIARLKAENDARRVLLIKAEADQKAEITDYKIRQEEAKRLGLAKELELLEAQKETAIERLKIIVALKSLIATESLIVEAEKRKAAALELVIDAEEALLEVKEEMVPLYLSLAEHKKSQAAAIIDEANMKAKIARLGYDWIDVKKAEAAAFVEQKAAELNVEYARTEYIRAAAANEEARTDGSASLADARNSTTDTVISLREALKQAMVDLRLDTNLERFLRDIDNRISIQVRETQAVAEKLTAQLASMTAIASSQAARIKACATTTTVSTICRHNHHYVNSD